MARTVKVLINERVISEVERVTIAAREAPSVPYRVANKENKQEAAAAEELAVVEARKVTRRARAKEEIERQLEAEEEGRQQARKEKLKEKEKKKIEAAASREREKHEKQAARKQRLALREAEFQEEAAAAKQAAAARVQRVWRGAFVRIAARSKAGDRVEILKAAMEEILRKAANGGEADVADVGQADQAGMADDEKGNNADCAKPADERSLRRHAEVDADTVAEIEQTLLNYQHSCDHSPLYFPCGFSAAQRATVHQQVKTTALVVPQPAASAPGSTQGCSKHGG